MMHEKSCSLCNFFDENATNNQIENPKVGICRYDSPKVTSDQSRATWPVVKQEDWCGKFLSGN